MTRIRPTVLLPIQIVLANVGVNKIYTFESFVLCWIELLIHEETDLDGNLPLINFAFDNITACFGYLKPA